MTFERAHHELLVWSIRSQPWYSPVAFLLELCMVVAIAGATGAIQQPNCLLQTVVGFSGGVLGGTVMRWSVWGKEATDER